MSTPQIETAKGILLRLGLPRGQLNDRSALTLLALLQLGPDDDWTSSKNLLLGVTPIMDWISANYGVKYAPNTRETIRRQTLHQFVEAAIAQYNPDNPDRATNSPHAAYKVSPAALKVFRSFGSDRWEQAVAGFSKRAGVLSKRYAAPRKLKQVPVSTGGDIQLKFSPGKHSQLISSIIVEFAPRFAPGSDLIYAGDTGRKFAFFDEEALAHLGVAVNTKGKMPDVVLYFRKKKWLLLIEAVTSHGPVDAKRHAELAKLFKASKVGLVYVTAFPDTKTFSRYLRGISWETEVWAADNPDHLIHFNGKRFLGPY